MTKHQLLQLLLDGAGLALIIAFVVYLRKFRLAIDEMTAKVTTLEASNNAMIAAIAEHKLAILEFIKYAKPLFESQGEEPPPTPRFN
ncbi:MAG TPA: hypothetical protein VND65_18005 [Candidatus Binatia bacterium]|nr:hypothetical protein [Candidatus Binatia bacterium]